MLGELAYRRDQNGWALELLRAAVRLDPEDKASQILIDVVSRAAEQTAIDGDKTERRDPLTKLARIPAAARPKAARPAGVAVLPSQGRVPGVRMMFIYGALLGVVGLFGGLFLLGRGGTTPKAKKQANPAAASAAPSPTTEPVVTSAAGEPASEPTDAQLAAAFAGDTWLHPLAGPERRMPVRDSRVFGAERPGERPVECRSGHCGVDIGQTWGEPVHCAHDGVIDRVQRGPNEDHGGLYVRIAHRGGTIFTQYFHLAAIPRRIRPGLAVRAGEVIGIVGDSGVKNSGPHLHFTASVKPAKDVPERYIDPEPLIALWPVYTPGGPGGDIDVAATPGLPRGRARGKKHAHHSQKEDSAPEVLLPVTAANR
jgi:murein DD-endopeptidase MepM/ murein hydrolase activator NlpD